MQANTRLRQSHLYANLLTLGTSILFLLSTPGIVDAQSANSAKPQDLSDDLPALVTEWTNIYNSELSGPYEVIHGPDNRGACTVNFVSGMKVLAGIWHKNYLNLVAKHDPNPSIDAAKPLLPGYRNALATYTKCETRPATMETKDQPPYYDPHND